MIEKEMEELIAQHPEEFFPRKVLILKGRQETFVSVGRFDLLFEDQFGSQILMELKARPAKYEDATQLAKYKEAIDHQGRKNVIMWLVAPLIPKPVRDFMDTIGIQYSEIHEAEFRQVAANHSYLFASEVKATSPGMVFVEARARSRPTSSESNPDDRSKRERVIEILQDGQWHTAADFRGRLQTEKINPVLHRLAKDGIVELRKRKTKGEKRENEVRLKIPRLDTSRQ